MNTQNNTPASRNEEAVRLLIDALDRYMRQDETADDIDNGVYRNAKDVMSIAVSAALAAPGAAIDAREQEPFGFICDFDWGEAHGKVNLHRHPDPEKGRVVPVYRIAPSEALSPATVAQPAAEIVTFGYLDGQKEVSWSKGKMPPVGTKLYAQPCASQGCGGAVSEVEALRAEGWSVAVHNDYKLQGVPYTFWLFTRGDRAVKGEGQSDAEALAQVRAALSTAKSGGGATPEGGEA